MNGTWNKSFLPKQGENAGQLAGCAGTTAWLKAEPQGVADKQEGVTPTIQGCPKQPISRTRTGADLSVSCRITGVSAGPERRGIYRPEHCLWHLGFTATGFPTDEFQISNLNLGSKACNKGVPPVVFLGENSLGRNAMVLCPKPLDFEVENHPTHISDFFFFLKSVTGLVAIFFRHSSSFGSGSDSRKMHFTCTFPSAFHFLNALVTSSKLAI